MNFIVKIASDKEEFAEISRLNYETFVEEIPQHHENEHKELLDRFHDENEYIICKEGSELLGMMALRDKRPFSLDEKLNTIEQHLEESFVKPCEVRLLAVKKKYRNGRVFTALTSGLIRYCLQKGYDIAFISGTTRQAKLYRHLGFEPFAHLVGNDDAWFQPMYLTKKKFLSNENLKAITKVQCLLPGPVILEDEVLSPLNSQPIWHRSNEHKSIVQSVNRKLKNLTKAKNVVVLTGSGTLGNDAVAAHLASLKTKGLIISNGEFGERLIDHAIRFQLNYKKLSYSWGQPFQIEDIRNELLVGKYDWIWFVHCETSTGMLNDLSSLIEWCDHFNVKVCVDAISSIGAVPVNLESVYLATGVAGKAIGAITGLSFVFFNALAHATQPVPRYLDIMYYKKSEGIPFSQNSNLFHALDRALDKHLISNFYENRYHLFKQVIELFENQHFTFVVPKHQSSPCVITLSFPSDFDTLSIGDNLFLNGYLVHYRNRYLIDNNWIQIALMNPKQNIGDIKEIASILKKLVTKNINVDTIPS